MGGADQCLKVGGGRPPPVSRGMELHVGLQIGTQGNFNSTPFL